jgi:uncharacterized protein (DUF488 family)
MRLLTIGVYGYKAPGFRRQLRDAGVTHLLDVRQRRGVRGAQYSWANAAQLEAAMGDEGIEYRHVKELAPTTELRELQYAADAQTGEGKRSRTALAPEYVDRYTEEILGAVDVDAVLADLPADAVVALLCVERDPEACHRSLAAARLAERLGAGVEHLRPR